jgi:hypothetical protein
LVGVPDGVVEQAVDRATERAPIGLDADRLFESQADRDPASRGCRCDRLHGFVGKFVEMTSSRGEFVSPGFDPREQEQVVDSFFTITSIASTHVCVVDDHDGSVTARMVRR